MITQIYSNNTTLVAVANFKDVYLLQNVAFSLQQQFLHFFLLKEGHSDYVKVLLFSNNDKILATGSSDCTIKLWNVENRRELKTLLGHSSPITSLAFDNNNGNDNGNGPHKDNKYIASGCQDGTIIVWDINTGQMVQKFIGHTDIINSMSFHHTSDYIVSGSMDMSVKFWDIQKGKEMFELDKHSTSVLHVSFDKNCQFLATATKDNIIHIWTFNSQYSGPNPFEQKCDTEIIKLLFIGHYLIVRFSSGTTKIWDADTKELTNFDKNLQNTFGKSAQKQEILQSTFK